MLKKLDLLKIEQHLTTISICFKWHPWIEIPAFPHMYPIFHFYLLHFSYVSIVILDLKNQLFTYPIFCFYLLHFPYVSNDILDSKNQFFCISYIPLLFTLFSTCFKWHPWFKNQLFFHILSSTFDLLFSVLEACRWINNSHRIVRQSPSVVNWMLGWISSLRTLSNDTKASNIRWNYNLRI
jgi:hypothetical protein